MRILSPTKSEKLSIDQYIEMMSNHQFNQHIKRTTYQINHDWSSSDTGHFIVEYDRPMLREKQL